MSTQAKYLALSARQTDCSPGAVRCQAVESLAGDCRLGFAERLKMVEADCRFGASCTRGCHQIDPPSYGFVGEASVLPGIVGPIEAASNDGAIELRQVSGGIERTAP
jgi:hypothetical protein